MKQRVLFTASTGSHLYNFHRPYLAGFRDLGWEVHAACGGDFLTITPGVRFAGGDVGDQVRVTTPARAREIGSDYIVVGRPITGAEDPVAAYRRCVAEFVG